MWQKRLIFAKLKNQLTWQCASFHKQHGHVFQSYSWIRFFIHSCLTQKLPIGSDITWQLSFCWNFEECNRKNWNYMQNQTCFWWIFRKNTYTSCHNQNKNEAVPWKGQLNFLLLFLIAVSLIFEILFFPSADLMFLTSIFVDVRLIWLYLGV